MGKAEFTSYQTPRIMADAGSEYHLTTDGSMQVMPTETTSTGPGSSKTMIIAGVVGLGLLAWLLLGRKTSKRK